MAIVTWSDSLRARMCEARRGRGKVGKTGSSFCSFMFLDYGVILEASCLNESSTASQTHVARVAIASLAFVDNHAGVKASNLSRSLARESLHL